MNDVDILRSKYKEKMLELELGMLQAHEDGIAEVGEIETKLGIVYVTLFNEQSVSLYDSDKKWLMPIESSMLNDLYVVNDIDDFGEALGLTCIVRSEDQQELVEASREAGLDNYDLIYRIGKIYFMFDTPELLNFAVLDD